MTAAASPAGLPALLGQEEERFVAAHPASARLAAEASGSLLGGVPMTWMAKWPGPFPVFLERARGARLEDVDGHTYVDLCLGDTGAMAGHSPRPVADAVTERLAHRGGATTMLPTEDAARVAGLLADRFGLPTWSFALSATDANRWVLRLCRHLSGRRKVLVFDGCYHGTVDETFAVLRDGRVVARDGNVGAPADVTTTTRVCAFNDLDAVERELAHGDVACVLTEPALTNIGIVLPEPGFLDGLAAACRRSGTLLVIDETHTLSAGYGGCTRAWGLRPDVVTIGKAIAGGVPIGAFGLTAELAARVTGLRDADLVDTGGVGGTLAGNALSLAAARATLADVLTQDAMARMVALGERYATGLRGVLAEAGLAWSVVGLGARAEFAFVATPPRDGAAAAAAHDDDLDRYVHLALLNRGVLLTPFHAMALMSPATTAEDVDAALTAFAEVLAPLGPDVRAR
jgi:glutamate-1-semialdehyde 2,1-aminomutase